jgi:hypothetical protein
MILQDRRAIACRRSAAYDGGFNRWMQHTKDCASNGSVADETATPDLLQREAESADVGSLAEGRISPEDRPAF